MQHKPLLDELITNHMGIEIHSIHFVSRSVITMTPQNKLDSVGLSNLVPVFFDVYGSNYSKIPNEHNLANLAGVTVCAIENGDKMPVIFLPNDTPDEVGLDAEIQEEWKYLLQFLALIHELAHAKDMLEEINYKFQPESINLVEAESYAHAFALNYCHRIGATVARNTYANALYDLHDSQKDFENKLYRSICSRIGKGRLKNWAKA